MMLRQTPSASITLSLLGIIAAFVLIYLDSIWSWSVDLAHHYALVFRISEQFELTSSADPTLQEMSIYPRGSHVIAAIIGSILGSKFLGLQVVTLLSLAVLWLFAILILKGLPVATASTSLIILSLLIVINAISLKLELHGGEIVGNFFYSQLVGHSILFASIFIAIKLEKSAGVVWSCFALSLLMMATAAVHLLPAIQMLGLLAGLLVAHVVMAYRKDAPILPRIMFSVPLLALSVGGLFSHPSFSAMRKISKNDGVLDLHNVSYPVGLVLLCFSVFAASMLILYRLFKSGESNEFAAAKYLAILGFVTAMLCSLQFVLVILGHGSDYAVKKYGFSLITILFLQLSVIFAGNGRLSWVRFLFSRHGEASRTVVSGAALALVLFSGMPNGKPLDVSDVVVAERRLINLSDTVLPKPHDGRPSVVIGLDGFPATIDYLFSIAIVKTPRTLAEPDVLLNRDITTPSNYSFIASSSGNPKFGAAKCETLSDGPISIINSRCFEKAQGAAGYCNSQFDFSTAGSIPRNLIKGFSDAEGHGRWTDGVTASVECLDNGEAFKNVKLQVAPFVYGALKSQRIEVTINGQHAFQEEIGTARGTDNPIVIPLPRATDSGKYTLEFRFPDAVSPKEVGLNEDRRRLGFSFKRVMFE